MHSTKKRIHFIIIFTLTAILLYLTRNRWADFQIDFGREVYIPWQITEGARLYTDVAYFNGPFSPYFNAIWFKLFGSSLNIIFAVNTIVLCVILIALYHVLAFISSINTALIACIIALFVFCFGHLLLYGNFNFIAPYSHEMTHGLCLSLLAILTFQSYLSTNKLKWISLSGFFIGCTALTKPEIFLGIGAPAVLVATLNQYRTRSFKVLVLWFSGLTIPILLAILNFNVSEVFSGILSTANKQATSNKFYQIGLGFDEPLKNAIRMQSNTFAFALIVFFITVTSLKLRFDHSKMKLSAAAVFVAIFLGVFSIDPDVLDNLIQRPLPALALAVLIFWTFRFFKTGKSEKQLMQIFFAAFSFCLLGKMFLNARFWQYGFVLALPAFMLIIMLLIDWIPSYVKIKGGSWLLVKALFLGFLFGLTVDKSMVSALRYIAKNVPIENEDATLFLENPRAQQFQASLDLLKKNVAANETIAVLPEGVMYNFFLKKKAPTPYISLMPLEVLLYGESVVTNAYKTSPPDYLVFPRRSTQGYGFSEFGRGYAEDLYLWLQNNYEILEVFKDERNIFQVEVLKKKES